MAPYLASSDLLSTVQTPLQILEGATIHAVRLMRREGQIGQIGQIGQMGQLVAVADLLMINGNPLPDATLLGDPQKSIKLLMQGGRIVPKAAA